MGTDSNMKTIQKHELDILVYFDGLCKKSGLTYYLAYGTLLGAIRHKGFIPWDDDVDVAMPRPDFERLLSIVDNSGRYKLYSIYNDKKWSAPLAKLVDTKTVLKQKYHRESLELGLYIDIFIIDGVTSDKKEQLRFYRHLYRLQKMWSLCEHEKRPIEGIYPLLKNIASLLLSGLYGARKFALRLSNDMCKYDYKNESTVYNIEFNNYRRKNTLCKTVYGEGQEVEFEGMMFNAPAEYSTYLNSVYGDYMSIPPEEKRISNHDYTLHFKDC